MADCWHHYEEISFTVDEFLRLRRYAFRFAAGAAAVFTVATAPALAVDQVHDEIQVYNAEIAAVGQWTYEQHLNYASVGQTQPEVPGWLFLQP